MELTIQSNINKLDISANVEYSKDPFKCCFDFLNVDTLNKMVNNRIKTFETNSNYEYILKMMTKYRFISPHSFASHNIKYVDNKLFLYSLFLKDRISNVEKIEENKSLSVPLYNSVTGLTFNYYELLDRLNLGNRIGEIFILLERVDLIEGLMFYLDKYTKKYDKINIHRIIRSNDIYQPLIDKMENKLKDFYDFDVNQITIDDLLNIKIRNKLVDQHSKQDLIFLEWDLQRIGGEFVGTINHTGTPLMAITYLHQLIIYMKMGLDLQKKGGLMIVRIVYILQQGLLQLIYLLSYFYDSVEIIDLELDMIEKGRQYLICRGFKNNYDKYEKIFVDIIQQLKKNDPSFGLNLYIDDPVIKKKYHLDKVEEISKKDGIDTFTKLKNFNTKFIQSLFKFTPPIPEKYIKKIVQYQRQKIDKAVQRDEYLADMFQILQHKSLENILFRKIKAKQIHDAIQWCFKYQVKMKAHVLENIKEYDRYIINQLYVPEEMLVFTFDYDGERFPQLLSEYETFEIPSLKRLEKKFHLFRRYLDTRDLKAYWKWNAKMKLFESLKHQVKRNTNAKPVTRAWLKLYEILHRFKLIPRDREIDKFRTFDICAAPGSFVYCINHFIHTKTKIKEYDWYATSLNPRQQQEKYVDIGDEFRLMVKYPKRWLFGKDNTGNIMSRENIIDHKKKLVEVDLIVSDCGIPLSETKPMKGTRKSFQKIKHHTEINTLNLYTMIATWLLLPLGKHFVFKTFLPLGNIGTMSWIYLVYLSFKKLYVCKPLTSKPNSAEVYIVGMGFKGLPDRYVDQLFKIIKDFRVDRAFIRQKDFSDAFLNQIEACERMFVGKNIKSISRSIYHHDIAEAEKMDEEYIKMVEKAKIRKNRHWLEENRIKNISEGKKMK